GSTSCCGADGPFLEQVLQRAFGGGEELVRVIQKSLLISADNAHGLHPNYPDKHDGNHGPKLNAGPVIQGNSNQRYATSSITASRLGVPTVDIGLPTFAMHSIRELAGSQDLAHLVKVLTAFYNSAELI